MQVSEESFETCLKSLLFILVLYKHGWAIYLLKKNPISLIDWLIGKRILYFSNGDCNFFIHITAIFLGWLDIRNYVIKQLTTKVCPSIVLDIAATLYWNNSSSWSSLQHGGWTRQISWSFWHRRVSCCKSTWDFITFLDCCLGNGHISYRIFLKLAGPYISSQLEPMGKVKWEEKPKNEEYFQSASALEHGLR